MTKTWQHRRRISAIDWLETSGTLALLAIFVLAVICASAAQGQTYTVLHRFQGPPMDGVNPQAGLIGDSAGNLYGTTEIGGASGYGVVFKVDETGETVLYSFTGGVVGANPYGDLIRDSAGNLYGTTYNGGDLTCSKLFASGCGVVFKLDTTGTETVLHIFTGADGANPNAGVIRDSAGNLYGTTYSGSGEAAPGVVFKLHATGTETVLYKFRGSKHGFGPLAGVIRDSAGNLYGTTQFGGSGSGYCPELGGTVFKLDTTGTEMVLHSFTGADGAYPWAAGVIRDAAGNLYGTTLSGGASHFGVVFKLDTTGKETVLYSFTGGADGAPPTAGVIRDSAGNLYGTTQTGGASGWGVVFELDTTGKKTVLYGFTGGADGGIPVAGLRRDSAGNLYGTTLEGGIITNACPYGCGVVFKLTP